VKEAWAKVVYYAIHSWGATARLLVLLAVAAIIYILIEIFA
jgi:hypothetical protein